MEVVIMLENGMRSQCDTDEKLCEFSKGYRTVHETGALSFSFRSSSSTSTTRSVTVTVCSATLIRSSVTADASGVTQCG